MDLSLNVTGYQKLQSCNLYKVWFEILYSKEDIQRYVCNSIHDQPILFY